jgi:hypothetical protein
MNFTILEEWRAQTNKTPYFGSVVDKELTAYS